jgi:cell division transport system permease protein
MRANFVASEVTTGLRRNLTMTVAMIITTAISLGFFGCGMLIAHQVSDMKGIYFDKLEVSIYLKDGITPPERDTLKSQLDASPEVVDYQFLTKEQAFERFKQLFRGNPTLVSQTTSDDIPATYLVKLKDPERYTVLSEEFSGMPGVDQVQGQSAALDRIFTIFNGIRNGAIVIALLQALASLLLIGNMIQIAAYNRRVETGIMRLVGASRWYTQLPFVLEAAAAGLAGALLGIGLLFAFKSLFYDTIFSEPIRSGILPPLDVGTIGLISPWVLLVGVGLSSVAAYITLRLYVRL